MSKSNISHLRDILEKFELEPNAEALEFLEAIEEEMDNLKSDNSRMKDESRQEEIKIEELEDEIEKLGTQSNSNFVGLDTITWGLKEGNLKIQMQMERFIETLQKQNCVSITA